MRVLAFALLCLTVGCAAAAVEPEPEPISNQKFREVMQTMEKSLDELRTTARYDTANAAAERLVDSASHITRYGKADKDGTPIREKADFQQWAAALKTATEELQRTVAAGDPKANKAALAEVNKTCNSCHAVYNPRPW